MLITGLIAILGIWLINVAVKAHSDSDIQISHDSGFYRGAITVKVSSVHGNRIYYSMSPGKELLEYEDPITLAADEPDNAYRLEFVTIDEDGEYSDTVERSFLLLGENRNVSTDYIAMIWGDEDELFGYEEGILVRGKTFDEYMEANPETNIYEGMTPANYYNDIERNVSLSLFRNTGEEIVSQKCGMRVLGNYNRIKNQKSVKLTARYVYDDKNEFAYELFPELISEKTGSPINDFHSIAIQNSGDDNGYCFIRNALCNELASEAGFPDTLSSKSVTLWINNHYRGVFWLQNYYDKRYFKEKYGEYEGEFAVNEGKLAELVVDEKKSKCEIESANDYNSFCAWLKTAEPNNEVDWERITSTIDIDNFIKYIAIEYYISNTDWVGNNVKVFRYCPSENEEYILDSVFDGKYRYLMHDLDYGLGLKTFGYYGYSAKESYLPNIAEYGVNSYVTAKLFERAEVREQFVEEVLLLINGAFSPDCAIERLEKKISTQWNELDYMLSCTDVMSNSMWKEDECSFDDVINEKDEIIEFLIDRPLAVLKEIDSYWECGDISYIYTDAGELAILIDGQENSRFMCVDNIPVTLSCDTKGITIDGWYINDNYIPGEELTVIPGDYKNSDNQLLVIPVWRENGELPLSIEMAYTNGPNDKIVIINKGLISVNLEDYAISDDADKLMKGILPDYILKPGEKIEVLGEKYSPEHGENYFQVDFSWNDEEEVYLSHRLEGIVEKR